MLDVLNIILQLLQSNPDAAGLTAATAIATGLVVALRALFSLARRLAKKTSTSVDDRIVAETETVFKDKSRDI